MIQYDPFWRTRKEKGISAYMLINKLEISSSTIQRMRKNKAVTTTKIDDLCRILHCRVEEYHRICGGIEKRDRERHRLPAPFSSQLTYP